MLKPRLPKSSTLPPYSFRCPSCLGVLTVRQSEVGTCSPCPLCAVPIVAPEPLPDGIPFAYPEGMKRRSPDAKRTPSGTSNRVLFVDGGLSQSGLGAPRSSQNGQTIFFIILGVLFLLVGLWLIFGR